MASTIVTFELGDREVEVMVRPMTTLQTVLRYQLGQTAVKEGCRQGGCGSCTVLVDGEPVMSCLLPVEEVAGRRVDTLETAMPTDGSDPLQQAFIEQGAFQCGYCTPAMIMTARHLLAEEPHPSRERIREHLNGNLCRCGCYPRIEAAIAHAAGHSGGETT